MTSPFVVGVDALSGTRLRVRAKAFIRGLVRDEDPAAALVVQSDEGDVLAIIGLNATDAHVLSEQLRQQAELVAVIEEENQA